MNVSAPNNRSLAIQVDSGAGKRRLISLTPLIDVVFILLDSPVQGATQDVGPPALVVQLADDGGLTLDGADVTSEALTSDLRAALEAAPDRPVVVQPGPGVPLQRVVTLLGRLSALPVPAVSLMRAERPSK